jgi:hypothetical protein
MLGTKANGKKVIQNGRAVYKHKHVVCHQAVNFEMVVGPFLHHKKFSNIIEIGTANGGFTYFMSDTLPDASIYSYDIRPRKKLQNEYLDLLPNVKCYVESPFTETDDGRLIVTNTRFLSQLKLNRLLIVCDGGNKAMEVHAVVPLLKPGDYIMFHDYGASDQQIKWLTDTAIWSNFEILYSDIEQVLRDNNVQIVHPELNNAAWGCAKKM